MVDATFDTINSFESPVAVAFDYLKPQFISKAAEGLELIGEPLLFGIESDAIVEMLQNKGMQILDHPVLNEDLLPLYMPVNAHTGNSLGASGRTKSLCVVGNAVFPKTE